MTVSRGIIQDRSTAEYATTLQIALTPTHAMPIVTTVLMVNWAMLVRISMPHPLGEQVLWPPGNNYSAFGANLVTYLTGAQIFVSRPRTTTGVSVEPSLALMLKF